VWHVTLEGSLNLKKVEIFQLYLSFLIYFKLPTKANSSIITVNMQNTWQKDKQDGSSLQVCNAWHYLYCCTQVQRATERNCWQKMSIDYRLRCQWRVNQGYRSTLWMPLVHIIPNVSLNPEPTMGDKSGETLCTKFNFRASWKHFPPFPPFPPNNVAFSFLSDCRLQHLHNIELGGQGYQRINARSK